MFWSTLYLLRMGGKWTLIDEYFLRSHLRLLLRMVTLSKILHFLFFAFKYPVKHGLMIAL